MELNNFITLILLLVIAFIPLLFNSQYKTRIFQRLKYFFPAIIFTSAIFIIWDNRFTEIGIWNYNPAFFSGREFFSLPWEKWLYYAVISWVALFIYEWVKIKFKNLNIDNYSVAISLFLVMVFGLIAFFSREKVYTFFTFFLLAIYFGYSIFRNRFKSHFTHFYIAYLILLVPFFAVSVFLVKLPAITYNAEFTLPAQIMQVPIENLAGLFLLLFINITIAEYLTERRSY
ncbi:MAG: lycopene cyclase domain-containing protein [Prolixibacteraceae bacterium]|nr:lycopene cyclase domain-containing protein [Prolixibacteraceae bacterium]